MLDEPDLTVKKHTQFYKPYNLNYTEFSEEFIDRLILSFEKYIMDNSPSPDFLNELNAIEKFITYIKSKEEDFLNVKRGSQETSFRERDEMGIR